MPRGGYRAGSGRKPGVEDAEKDTPGEALTRQTPLEYLLEVMNDPNADKLRRDRAASVAAPFVHGRAGEIGKKGEKQKAAEQAESGKFKPSAAPRLIINNR